MNKPLPNLPAYLALALGVFCIGTSAIFVKFANVPGPVSALYRVAIAALVLVPLWLLRRSGPPPAWRDLQWVVLGGLFFALDLTLWNTGILLTTAANATLLANNAPLWVGLGALFLFHEKLPRRYWLGLFAALIGMVVIVGGDAWRLLHFNLGDLLAIAASLFYAAYMLTTQRARMRVDTLTFNAVYLTAAVLVLLPFNLLTGTQLTGFSRQTWLALFGLGLFAQVIGWVAINYALGHLQAAHVSVTLLGQPVVTAILGVVLLGELLTVNQACGGLLVLFGIYLVNLRNQGKPDLLESPQTQA
jgi:drug/metabolite transporter (DMT)-like permease